MKKPKQEFNLGEFAFFVLVIIGILFVAVLLSPAPEEKPSVPMAKFESCGAITAAFRENADKFMGDVIYEIGGVMPVMSSATGGAKAPSYSTTNVQVEGVDEADIVKTDGKYIYVVSGSRLIIADAYPAESAKILSSTELGGDITAQEMFIGENSILVFASNYVQEYAKQMEIGGDVMMPGFSTTVVQLWDVSDREIPKFVKSAEFEGSYLTSRKIGSTAYFVINSYPDYRIYEGDANIMPVPQYRELWGIKEYTNRAEAEKFVPIAKCAEIGYFSPIQASAFVTIASMNIDDQSAEIKKQTVVATGRNVYASLDALYLAEVNYNYGFTIPFIGDVLPPENPEETIIHKFLLNDGEVSYSGFMEAPGHILNQFSMDEFNGYFRIATTRGEVSRLGGGSTNNIYVFNSDLNMAGKLEELAPGEKIYSARFMGEKAYLVTFKKVDPLFVIDLSNPEKPEVLGKLKIPGYSDYLHPIDETHIIGLGKEALEADEGDFAWYQGIKIAIFDVSDVENPKEMHKTVIGDRGTDSYALHDHKAFLYDRGKNLLVIPILLAEINEEQYPDGVEKNTYGDYTFQGAYVYGLTLENGFELKGRLTHLDADDESLAKSGYYYGSDNAIRRALYIDDALYTISDAKILANSLGDLSQISELKIA